jgi:hypothetical protein
MNLVYRGVADIRIKNIVYEVVAMLNCNRSVGDDLPAVLAMR